MVYRTSMLSIAILAMASIGQMGWAQSTVGDLVPFSSLGSPTAIVKPTLTLRGGTLLLSDSPEQFKNAAQLPAVMYRDQVKGDFRVFYHHQNESSQTLSVGVAVTNTSNELELLFARGKGEGVNAAPDVAGQTAAASFIASRRDVSFATLLFPGRTYYQVQSLPNGDTASGILEYIAVAVPFSPNGNAQSLSLPIELLQNLAAAYSARGEEYPNFPSGFGPGTATVSTVAYTGAQPPDPVSLPVLPGDVHIRGTFAHSNRSASFTIPTTGGLQYLSVDTSAPGKKYSNPMPNEYELGVDAVDGGTQVYDDGNYGVVYNFHVEVQRAGSLQTIAMLMQPSGGAGHYLAFTDGQEALSPYVTYKSAWWFSNITLQREFTQIDLQLTLPGGAAGPQKLLFDPGFMGQ